jgi:hypothetical protein
MEIWMLAAVMVFGAAQYIILWNTMKGGFGPNNLRAFCLTSIIILTALIAILRQEATMAAIGLLSACAGYLFGSKIEGSEK